VTDNDGHYGDTSFWDGNWNDIGKGTDLAGQNNPSIKAGRVQLLKGIDKNRFRELFIDLMTRPINVSKM
jgi:hypothetical protein